MTAHRAGALTALSLCAALTVSAVPVHAAPAGSPGLPPVVPRAETAALHDDAEGGHADADDPAIWRNAADPGRSLVIATAKEGGLRVYDLGARQVQSLPAPPPRSPGDAPGRFNNVDLLHGMRLPGGRADLAVVSDRGHDRLRVYRIDRDRPGGPLTDVTDPAAAPIFSAGQEEINAEETAYGLATWTDRSTGRSYALVSRNNRTTVALLEITADGGTVGYRKVRSLDLPASFRLPDGTSWAPCGEPGELPQIEGMVVDPADGVLYAGQEDVGIWRLRADLRGGPELIDRVREYGVPAVHDAESDECSPAGADPGYGGEHLSADVEGLTLLTEPGGDGYVLASSQGDDSFALYDREPGEDNEYEGGFRVTAASRTLDGAEECDGAAVLNAPLGARYPNGLLVVQDGHETPVVDGREATGFTFVDLADVMDAVDD
ncbi:phytase [Streptomyces sp. URMC 125]|uniref:phytase n=1 Tax=Streptomyces sp. URMC 125 TaxID=3423419 RepID=UPI003F1AB418